MARKVKPAVKLFIILIGAALLVFFANYARKTTLYTKYVVPKGKLAIQQTSPEAVKAMKAGTPKITVAINTWGGYAPGLYYNGGLAGSTNSRFFKEQGIIVEFVLEEDLLNMRSMWKTGKVDVIGLATVDSEPAEINDLSEMKPQMFIKLDDSFGGDVAIGTADIKRGRDLEGKKISLLKFSPSHTLLLVWAEADGADVKKIEIVGKKDGMEPGQDFIARAVPAAIMWAPKNEECLKNVPGSHEIFSTRKASKAIMDVFITSDSYVQKNKEVLQKFVKGWLTAVAEINTNENAKKEAARVLSESPMKVSVEEALGMINNAKLSSYGDNLQFFGLKPGGVTGEEVYNKMYRLYRNAGEIKGSIPPWRNVSTSAIVADLNLVGKGHEAESEPKFTAPTKAEEVAPAFAKKAAIVNFPFNSADLSEDAKIKIDTYFAPQAKEFKNARVRIEGNTDNVGSVKINIPLSQKRAKSVANYLAAKYNFDPHRFVIVGNGFANPVSGCESNSTEDCRAQNRRTEFAILY